MTQCPNCQSKRIESISTKGGAVVGYLCRACLTVSVPPYPSSNTAQVTCPSCRRVALEEMPADRCVFFYECGGCGAILKPLPEDCCVFCSYADQPCPPKATGDGCRPLGPKGSKN